MRKAKIIRPVQIHELKITLCGSKPPIWRQVAVPSDMRLNDLHNVIQIVMGWTDSHLHQFIVSDNQSNDCCLSDPEAELDNAEDERKVKLSELAPAVKSKFIYEYDFGDGWKHLIEVVRIGPPAEGVKYPICIAGKLACLPEDCGGLGGYYNILEALKDPKREDYEDMLAWVGEDFDAKRFDLEEVNAALAREL